MKTLAFTLALLVTGLSSWAHSEPVFESRFSTMQVDLSTLRVERAGGRVLAAMGFITSPYAGSPEEIAIQFIRDLGFDDHGSHVKLVPIQTHTLPDQHVVRFQHQYRGIVLEGATTTVQVGHDRRVRSIHGLPSTSIPTQMKVRFTTTQAVTAALESVESGKEVEVGKIEQVILARGEAARLAHRVPLRKSVLGDMLFIYVDAIDGTILWKRNPISH